MATTKWTDQPDVIEHDDVVEVFPAIRVRDGHSGVVYADLSPLSTSGSLHGRYYLTVGDLFQSRTFLGNMWQIGKLLEQISFGDKPVSPEDYGLVPV